MQLFCWRPGDCCTKDGPTWDNPKLRHFYRLLNRLTAAMINENDVICLLSHEGPSKILVILPPDSNRFRLVLAGSNRLWLVSGGTCSAGVSCWRRTAKPTAQSELDRVWPTSCVPLGPICCGTYWRRCGRPCRQHVVCSHVCCKCASSLRL